MDLYSFYLPQFYPFKENDEFWGKGFTEWHNVARARPLFKGHYQPKLPGELGWYDLRLETTRQKQRELVKEYGLKGFIYWHYWFGGENHVMNGVLDCLIEEDDNEGFALAWANHNWYRKTFDSKTKDKLLLEVKYEGIEEYKILFYHYLKAFRKSNYLRKDGRLLYIIYQSEGFVDLKVFMDTWNRLASSEGLVGFYFITKDFAGRNYNLEKTRGFDAVYNDDIFNIHHIQANRKKVLYYLKRRFLKRNTVFAYADAIKHMFHSNIYKEDVIPVIAPRWDHSPRSNGRGVILKDETPELWKRLLMDTKQRVASKQNKMVIIKSWNEWGEGNFLEPDFVSGRKYLQMVKDVL